jgi:hypothetical protein
MSCWDPSPFSNILHVPTADWWHDGTHIKDEKGNIAYTILREEKVGMAFPIFRATIADENNEVLAVVVRERTKRGLQDSYTIYSMTPNWPGQEAVPYIVDKKKAFGMYALASIHKSVLGSNYGLISCQDGSALMKHKNGKILSAFLCSPFGVILGLCKLQFTFYKPGEHPRRFLVLRNQEAAIVSVDPGASPLMGVCMAYAVDRMTTYVC